MLKRDLVGTVDGAARRGVGYALDRANMDRVHGQMNDEEDAEREIHRKPWKRCRGRVSGRGGVSTSMRPRLRRVNWGRRHHQSYRGARNGLGQRKTSREPDGVRQTEESQKAT